MSTLNIPVRFMAGTLSFATGKLRQESAFINYSPRNSRNCDFSAGAAGHPLLNFCYTYNKDADGKLGWLKWVGSDRRADRSGKQTVNNMSVLHLRIELNRIDLKQLEKMPAAPALSSPQIVAFALADATSSPTDSDHNSHHFFACNPNFSW